MTSDVIAPPAVTVLAVNDEQQAAVTWQWIHTHDGTQWRLPGGRMAALDASLEEAARREFAEETGWRAQSWTWLGVVNSADSRTSHRDHAFLATGLLTAGESDLELHWISVARVVDMALNGLIPHADSAYAVLAAKVRGLL